MTVSADIRFEGVTFGYDGATVLEGVTFSVAHHDFVCVVGPNGGGKTTLLKLMLGLLRPKRGMVRMLEVNPVAARNRVGYMPQHATLDSSFPVNALEVVLMGRLRKTRSFGPYGAEDKAVARKMLLEVGLEDLASHSFATLSGGQRQRVLIARALASEPQVLLLDEPTASLDVGVEHEFYDLLRHLNEHERMTIVVVSHDLSFVSSHVRTVICVERTVHVHPTSELSGDLVDAVYGRKVRIVRHDHHGQCAPGEHDEHGSCAPGGKSE